MLRPIARFHQDEVGDWVADLSCGHRQHVRHRPPLWPRAWVDDEAGRAAHVGSELDCPACDRREPPEGLRTARRTPLLTPDTFPPGLRRRHRLARATWARIEVTGGRLELRFCDTGEAVVLLPGDAAYVAPEVDHDAEPSGALECTIEFLVAPEPVHGPEAGGEPACLAPLVCPECGAVAGAGGHREGCQAG